RTGFQSLSPAQLFTDRGAFSRPLHCMNYNAEHGTFPPALITTTRSMNARSDLRELASQTIELDGGAARAMASGEEGPASDELAAIFFTAGSTGTPKGVMLSHQNLISNARAIQEYL